MPGPLSSDFVRVIVVACTCAAATASAGGADAPAPAPAAPPDAAAVARADAKVTELFKSDLAAEGPAALRDVARRFREQAASGADEPAVRYARLRRACDLAASAGDFEAAFAAVDQLAAAFQVEPVALKLDTLTRGAAAARSALSAAALASAACSLGEDAAARMDLDTAAKASALATTASTRSRDAAVVARAKALAKRVAQHKADERLFEGAMKSLARDANDPRANLAAGRYLCVERNDWTAGVPLLAKSAEPAVKALAEKERARPATPDAMIALGDAWWELPDGRGGFTQAQARRRAVHWFEKALPDVKGVARMPVEARLTEHRLAEEAQSPRLALERLQRVGAGKPVLTAEGSATAGTGESHDA